MKIVLEAFRGKLRSEVMDWPEKTPPRVSLMMDMETMKVSDIGFYKGGMVVDKVMTKKGEFEWTGHYYPLLNGESAKRYVLIGIS